MKDPLRIIRLPTYRYVGQKGVVMDVKWEHVCDNGWAVCGNDWRNIMRDLVFQITYFEIVRDGWKRVE